MILKIVHLRLKQYELITISQQLLLIIGCVGKNLQWDGAARRWCRQTP